MSSGIAKLAIAVTAHFVESRLAYLRAVAEKFPTLADVVHIYVVTNADSGQRKKIAEALTGTQLDYEFVLPTMLGHPYLLSWTHLWLFRRLYADDPTITHFLYVEDDILVTGHNIAYWLKGRENLKAKGLLPSFLRYEINAADGEAYSSDTFEPARLEALPQVILDEHYGYVNLPQPYQGMYLMDRELMGEHLASISSSPDSGPWPIRETAAQGLTFANVPKGFSSRNLVGYRRDTGTLDPYCLVHHLPNNYADGAWTRLGKVRVDGMLHTSSDHSGAAVAPAEVVPALTPLEVRIKAIFDPDYYSNRYPQALAGEDAFDEYRTKGRHAGRDPNVLFDGAHYRRQFRGVAPPSDPLTHYLEAGAAQGLSPHPLFDTDYYLSELGGTVAPLTPLEHYLQVGWAEGRSPHPLFDPAFYARSGVSDPIVGDPLSHYLKQEEYRFAPHYLFSDEVYKEAIRGVLGARHVDAYRSGAPLLHYVQMGSRHRPRTHPLFDPGEYLANLQADPSKATRQEARRASRDPLRHYLTVGAKLGISPTPFFDVRFFTSQVPEVVGDPLRAYLCTDLFSRISPHPAINVEYYSRKAGFYPDDTPSVLHLLSTTAEDRVSPHPAFDVAFYRETNGDLLGTCPILHFLSRGVREDRSPNAVFSHEYVFNSDPTNLFAGMGAVQSYLSGDWSSRVRMVFVSHNASLTGAPGIALRLLEDFSRLPNVECFAVLGQWGERGADFKRVAHTAVVGAPFISASRTKLQEVVQQILAMTDGNEPIIAIVNSAESRSIIPELAAAGIPVITLVHETPDLYPPETFDVIVDNSEKVVFSSHFTLDRARSVVSLPEADTHLQGQGLLNEYIGTMDRGVARRLVREELGIADDTLLVINIGTVDYRKGADLFVDAASSFLERKPAGTKACFVWIGEGDRSFLSASVVAAIRWNSNTRDIRFIGSRTNVEPYLMAADVFMMTSRRDPFPCVCQEAMACALPVLVYNEGGGAIEMLDDGKAGFGVPMAHPNLLVDKLLELAADPELRRSLGEHGRSIAAARWQPQAYAEFLGSLVSEVSGIHLFPPAVAEGPGKGTVFFSFDDWVPSIRTARAESLVQALKGIGYDAKILLSRGRFARSAERAAPLPDVPFEILQPTGVARELGVPRTTAKEVFDSVVRLVARHSRCVIVAMDDPLVASFAALLPPRVGVFGMLHGGEIGAAQEMYELGPALDHVLSTSDLATTELVALNPSLQHKVHAIEFDTIGPVGFFDDARDLVYVRANRSKAATADLLVRIDRALAPTTWAVWSDLFKDEHQVSGLYQNGPPLDLDTKPRLAHQVVSALGHSQIAVFADFGPADEGLVLEAMAAGAVPLVVDPPDNVRSLIGANERGLIVDGSIIAGIERLQSDAAELTSRATAAAIWLAGRATDRPLALPVIDRLLATYFRSGNEPGRDRHLALGSSPFQDLPWTRERRRSTALSPRVLLK